MRKKNNSGTLMLSFFYVLAVASIYPWSYADKVHNVLIFLSVLFLVGCLVLGPDIVKSTLKEGNKRTLERLGSGQATRKATLLLMPLILIFVFVGFWGLTTLWMATYIILLCLQGQILHGLEKGEK